jgi:hypothetical protein
MDARFASIRLVILVLGGLLLAGCGGEGTPPDVPAGTYTAHVTGALSDTLTGPAHHRTRDGALTGLELGEKGNPGLSIELEPQPADPRTYEVVPADLFRLDRPNDPPGVLAFLSLEPAQFEAVDGTLELTYVGEEQVGATFSFEMEGRFEDGPSDAPSVQVTGALNAPPTP